MRYVNYSSPQASKGYSLKYAGNKYLCDNESLPTWKDPYRIHIAVLRE